MTPEEFKEKKAEPLFDKRTTVERLVELRDEWLKISDQAVNAPFAKLLQILIDERKGVSRG